MHCARHVKIGACNFLVVMISVGSPFGSPQLCLMKYVPVKCYFGGGLV